MSTNNWCFFNPVLYTSCLNNFVVFRSKTCTRSPTLNRQFLTYTFYSNFLLWNLNLTSYKYLIIYSVLECFRVIILLVSHLQLQDTGPFIGLLYFIPASPMLRIISYLLWNNKIISKASSWIKLSLIVTVNISLCLCFVTISSQKQI